MTIQQHISTCTPVMLCTAKEQSDFFDFICIRYPDTRKPISAICDNGDYSIAIVLDHTILPDRIGWSWANLSYFTEGDGKGRYRTPIAFSRALYKR